ncbi:5'-AMP-activated protein kinase beta subunit, interation domain-containing protein [Scheffersomyces amazonensis]|uniref:5'-AMP-activated protein kinase beta subunit, interation domain-containing protein n=1 Tax=Scheffersomyces amazonensis TaxID=1078765 RepID=UPI00315D7A40
MDVDETFNPSHRQHTHTPTPDLSKVDFTKITPVIDPSTNAANVEVKIDESYVHNNFNDSSIIPIQNLLIPVEIKWVNSTKEPINKISIIGSFSNWRDVIKLNNSTIHPNEYITTIKLPLGVHKLLYIINNEYRVSDQLPTATDQEGIFFNWFEVIDECHLFNHSLNQPNHIGASSDYDANIISRNIHHQQQQQQQQQQQPLSASMSAASSTSIVAGKSEVERINKKSTSFLTKISKEMSNFEHVEYAEDEDMKEVKLHEELQKHSQNYPYGPPPQEQQHHHHHLPPQPQPPQTISTSSVGDSSKYLPYESGLLTTSTSSLHIQHVKPPLEYSNDIPDMFVNYEFFKNKTNYELPEPPQLPAHLNNVLLNKISNSTNSQSNSNLPSTIPFQLPTVGQINNIHHHKRPPLRRADSSYYASNREASHLSIPNHVILNHLMTTSIRNDVLTVACITRYSGKFVTQIMHSPADK